MPLYIRCVLANKYTLAGYLLLFAGLTWLITGTIFQFFVTGAGVVLGLGLGLLLVSGFGWPTMRAYQSVWREFEDYRGGHLKRARSISSLGPFYRAGVDLALRDIDKQISKARQEPP